MFLNIINKVPKTTIYGGIKSLITLLFQFVVIRLLFEKFTLEEYAIISYPLIISSFAPFLELGVGKSCIDYCKKKFDLNVFSFVFFWITILSLFILSPLAIFYYYINNFDLWLFISFSSLISLLSQLYNFVHIGFLDFKKSYHKVYIGQIISSFCLLITTFLMLKNELSFSYLVFLFSTQPLSLLIYFTIINKIKFSYQYIDYKYLMRSMFKHGTTASLSALTIPLARIFSNLISPTLYAIFDISMKFSQVGTSAFSIFTNHLYGIFNSKSIIKKYFNLSTKLCLLNLILSILFFFMKDLVYDILNIEIEDSFKILPILIFFSLNLGVCVDPIFKYKLYKDEILIPILIKLIPILFITIFYFVENIPLIGFCIGFFIYTIANLIFGYDKE